MKFTALFQKDFNTLTWALIPMAMALNIVIGQIVLTLKLPVFLDTSGTILVAVLCGPWAGLLAGGLTNIIWGFAVDPNALPWWPVGAAIGLVAGLAAQGGLFKTWWGVALTGLFLAVTAALASTPIAVYLYGGITASGISFITAYLVQTGQDMVGAVLSANFLVEPVDKMASAMLAFALTQGLPARLLARFPRPENVSPDSTTRTQQVIIALVAVAVLIGVALLVLPLVLPPAA